MQMIEIVDGSKTFFSEQGDVAALANISLSIRESEFISLLGPSGLGKSN
jgi:ABC-type nitrate/sulfonate/bicarbonate transport system ATPase subunit